MKTRWLSVFYMLERFVEIYVDIMKLVVDGELNPDKSYREGIRRRAERVSSEMFLYLKMPTSARVSMISSHRWRRRKSRSTSQC